MASQSIPASQVLVIDDASTDPVYGPLAERLCDKFGFRYHRNESNLKCPHSLRVGIDLLRAHKEDVIFLLDGDDFLPSDSVFERFSEVYADRKIWLTYGNLEIYPEDDPVIRASAYPIEIIDSRDFRIESNFFNHPLTFRKFLWDQLDDSDMQDDDGEWFISCYDQVITVPLLEMAGGEHYLFLDETLYAYNSVNPLSEVHAVHDDRPRQLVKRPKKARFYR